MDKLSRVYEDKSGSVSLFQTLDMADHDLFVQKCLFYNFPQPSVNFSHLTNCCLYV